MTAIDTFADLLRTLDENPPLREELRVRILPREVLELPQQLARLAAAIAEHKQASAQQFAALNRQVSALDQKVEEYQQANTQQFAALNQKVAANTQQISALDQKVEDYQQSNTQQFAVVNQQISALDQKVEDYQQSNTQRFDDLDQKVAANTQQISALDQKVEDYQQANTQQFAVVNQRISALDQKVEDYQQANTRRFDAQDQKMEEYQQTNTQRFDTQDRRAEEYKQASEQRFRRIENDLAYLKGSHARYAALEYAEVIAEEMGLEYVRSLTRPDLYRMVRKADTAGISANALLSFRHADLIMEAVNAAGETCYIAVEISFTVDGRDTGRAIRNAGFLTRFTGREAHPAVAGVHHDYEIQPQIESGEVFWHHLPRKDMEAE